MAEYRLAFLRPINTYHSKLELKWSGIYYFSTIHLSMFTCRYTQMSYCKNVRTQIESKELSYSIDTCGVIRFNFSSSTRCPVKSVVLVSGGTWLSSTSRLVSDCGVDCSRTVRVQVWRPDGAKLSLLKDVHTNPDRSRSNRVVYGPQEPVRNSIHAVDSFWSLGRLVAQPKWTLYPFYSCTLWGVCYRTCQDQQLFF